MNHAIAALLLGQITWERACVLKIVKKETVDINMYRRRSTYGNCHGEFSSRVNEKECQTTKNPFPELLRVRAEIFKGMESYPEIDHKKVQHPILFKMFLEMLWELQLFL